MRSLKLTGKCSLPQDGYTLLQLAIGLLVLGLLSLPFLNLYTINNRYEQEHRTRVNMDNIQAAISGYKTTYGVYPCPAPMALPRSNPAYGHEVESADANKCRGATIAAIAPGSCGTGADSVCIQNATNSTRIATLAAQVPPASTRVIVGAIPFRLLQIEEKSTADGYGSKLLYAVTQSLTDDTKFKETNGAIEISDQNGQSMTNPTASASFVIVSPGPDQRGGYTLEGGLKAPCTGLGKDISNCNIGFQTGTTSPSASYISNLQNDAVGAQHFDDIVYFFTRDIDPLWRRVKTSAGVLTNNIQTVLPGNVGISQDDPSSFQLDIRSSNAMPVSRNSIGVFGTNGVDGKLISDRICNKDGTNCFDPSVIGGDNAVVGKGMKCPSGYMYQIANGAAQCVVQPDVTCPTATSPAGPVVVGTDASGNLICGSPAGGCSATSFTLCGVPKTVAATGNGGVQNFTGGTCAQTKYTCANSIWSVSSNASTSTCNFIPSIANVSVGLSCGFGYTGTYNTTISYLTCGAAGIGGNTSVSACLCTGGSRTNTQSCSSYYNNSFYTGNVTQTETKSPPSCNSVLGSWNTSACTCVPPSPSVQTEPYGSCPSGTTGTVTRTKTFNIGTCSWIYSSPVAACACNTTPITTTQNHTCADTTCEQPSTPDIFQTTINASTCTANAPQQTQTGTCQPKSFTYRKIGGPYGQTSPAPNNPLYVGSSCDCTAFKSGSQRFCYDSGDLSYNRYQCTCQ